MKIKSSKLFKIFVLFICFSMLFEQSGFAQIAGQLDISGQILAFRNSLIQDKFRPLHLRYLQYDVQSNNFKLLIDKGNSLTPSNPLIEQSTKTLLNYFLIGVSLPNDAFWVNLRPDSPDNIIDPFLAQTDVGKILLETDVQLKKDTARFTSPETPEGKEYWDKLYRKAGEIFGSQNMTIPTLTRPWIVPDEIIISETQDNAYIYKATLKVMLEEDYLKDSAVYNFKDDRLKELNSYASQILREKIIPKLTQEVNTSKRYAGLRQVYYSLILAQWFKQKFYGRSGIYPSRINKGALDGLTSKESWSKITYFQQYQQSFKDGEYNFKIPVSTPYGQVIRSYFSGGVAFGKMVIAPGNSTGPFTSIMRRRIVDFFGNVKNLLGVEVNSRGQVTTNNLDVLGAPADAVINALASGSLVLPISVNSNSLLTVTAGIVTINGRQIRISVNNNQNAPFATVNANNEVEVNINKINNLLNNSSLTSQERLAALARILTHDLTEAYALQSGLNAAEAHTAGMMAEAMHPAQSQSIRNALSEVLKERDSRQATQLKDGRGFGGEGSTATILKKVISGGEFQAFIKRTGVNEETISQLLSKFLEGNADNLGDDWSFIDLLSLQLKFSDSQKEMTGNLVRLNSYIADSMDKHGTVYLRFAGQLKNAKNKTEFNTSFNRWIEFVNLIMNELKGMESLELYAPQIFDKFINIMRYISERISDDVKRQQELDALFDYVFIKVKEIKHDVALKNTAGKNTEYISGYFAVNAVKNSLEAFYQFLHRTNTVRLAESYRPILDFTRDFIARRGEHLFEDATGGSHGLSSAIAHSDTPEELKENIAALNRFLVLSETRLKNNIPEYIIYNFMQRLAVMLQDKEGSLFAVYMDAISELIQALDPQDAQTLFSRGIWVSLFEIASKLSPEPANLKTTFLELASLLKEMSASGIYLESAESYLKIFSSSERNIVGLKEKVSALLSFKNKISNQSLNKDSRALVNLVLQNVVRHFSNLPARGFSTTLESLGDFILGILSIGNKRISEVLIENLRYYQGIISNKDKVAVALDIIRSGFIPTDGLVDYAIQKGNTQVAIAEFERVKADIANGGFRLDALKDAAQRNLYIDVEYSHFINVLLESGFGLSRLDYESYKEFISGVHRPGEVHLDAAGLAEIDYAIYEAKKLLDFIDKLIAQAKGIGKEVVVVANMSYGGFVLDIIEEELARRKIKMIRTKIGSTESHQNPWVFREDLFNDSDLLYITTNRPVMVVVDGTQHLVDREGDGGKRGRYPDAYQGYRNFVLAFNEALADISNDKQMRYRQAIGKDEGFIAAFGESFSSLKKKIIAILNGIKASGDYYDFKFWNPGGLKSILRENRQPLADADNFRPEQLRGPAIIFANVVLVDEEIPVALKRAHANSTHEPAHYDDNDVIKEIFLSVTDWGTQFEKKLKPIIGKRYPEVMRILSNASSFTGASGQVSTSNLDTLGAPADAVINALASGSLVLPISVNSNSLLTVTAGIVTINGRQIRISINNNQDAPFATVNANNEVEVNINKINNLLNNSSLTSQERLAALARILTHDLTEAYALQSGLNAAEAHTAGMMAEAMHPAQSQSIRNALSEVLKERDSRQATQLKDGRGFGGEENKLSISKNGLLISIFAIGSAIVISILAFFNQNKDMKSPKTIFTSNDSASVSKVIKPLTGIKQTILVSKKAEEVKEQPIKQDNGLTNKNIEAESDTIVIEELKAALDKEKNQVERIAIIELLGSYSNNAQVAVILVQALFDSDIQVAEKAAETLRKINADGPLDNTFVDMLINTETPENYLARSAIARAITSPDILIELLNLGDDIVSPVVAEVLGESNSPLIWSELKNVALIAESSYTAFEATKAIATNTNNTQSVADLGFILLNSKHPMAREEAARAMGELGGLDIEKQLQSAIEDQDQNVSKTAKQALEKIKKRNNFSSFQGASGQVSTSNLDTLGAPADAVINALASGSLVLPISVNSNSLLTVTAGIVTINGRQIRISVNNNQNAPFATVNANNEVEVNINKINNLLNNSSLTSQERLAALARILTHDLTEAYALQSGLNAAEAHTAGMMAEAMHPAQSQSIRNALSEVLKERDSRQATQLKDGRGFGGEGKIDKIVPIVEISGATVSDLEIVSGFRENHFVHNLRESLTNETSTADGFIKKYTPLIKSGDVKLFVARVNGEIVGYSLARKAKEYGWISEFTVRSDYQGKGVGTQLFRAALDFVKVGQTRKTTIVTYDLSRDGATKRIAQREEFGFKEDNSGRLVLEFRPSDATVSTMATSVGPVLSSTLKKSESVVGSVLTPEFSAAINPTQNIIDIVTSLERTILSESNIEQKQILEVFLEFLQRSPPEFAKVLSGATRGVVSLADLTGVAGIEFYAEGSNKKVYKVTFQTRKGTGIVVSVAIKKEKDRGRIQQNEIEDLIWLNTVKRRTLGLVPFFWYALKTKDGRDMYIEEFIEGRTIRELQEAGLLNEAIRKEVVKTIFKVGILLGNNFPRDMHEDNLIFNGTVVMVDVGNKRFAVELALRGNRPETMIEFLFFVFLHYSMNNENDFIIPALFESLQEIEDFLKQNKIDIVRAKKRMPEIKKEINDFLNEAQKYIVGLSDVQKDQLVSRLMANTYVRSYCDRHKITDSTDREALIKIQLLRIKNSLIAAVSGPAAQPGQVVTDQADTQNIGRQVAMGQVRSLADLKFRPPELLEKSADGAMRRVRVNGKEYVLTSVKSKSGNMLSIKVNDTEGKFIGGAITRDDQQRLVIIGLSIDEMHQQMGLGNEIMLMVGNYIKNNPRIKSIVFEQEKNLETIRVLYQSLPIAVKQVTDDVDVMVNSIIMAMTQLGWQPQPAVMASTLKGSLLRFIEFSQNMRLEIFNGGINFIGDQESLLRLGENTVMQKDLWDSLSAKYGQRIMRGDDLKILERWGKPSRGDLLAGIFVANAGEIIADQDALFCNYIIIQNRLTKKTVLIHTSDYRSAEHAREIIQESLEKIGINDQNRTEASAIIVRSIDAVTEQEGFSSKIESLYADALDAMQVARVQTDKHSAWGNKAKVRFLVDEGIFLAIPLEADEISRVIFLKESVSAGSLKPAGKLKYVESRGMLSNYNVWGFEDENNVRWWVKPKKSREVFVYGLAQLAGMNMPPHRTLRLKELSVTGLPQSIQESWDVGQDTEILLVRDAGEKGQISLSDLTQEKSSGLEELLVLFAWINGGDVTVGRNLSKVQVAGQKRYIVYDLEMSPRGLEIVDERSRTLFADLFIDAGRKLDMARISAAINRIVSVDVKAIQKLAEQSGLSPAETKDLLDGLLARKARLIRILADSLRAAAKGRSLEELRKVADEIYPNFSESVPAAQDFLRGVNQKNAQSFGVYSFADLINQSQNNVAVRFGIAEMIATVFAKARMLDGVDSRDYYEGFLQDPTKVFVVVNQKGEVFGYLIYLVDSREHSGYVDHIYIDPVYQGQRFEDNLMDATISARSNPEGVRASKKFREFFGTDSDLVLKFVTNKENVEIEEYGEPELQEGAAARRVYRHILTVKGIGQKVFYTKQANETRGEIYVQDTEIGFIKDKKIINRAYVAGLTAPAEVVVLANGRKALLTLEVEGRPLAELISEKPSLDSIKDIVQALAYALGKLHALGIVHGDLAHDEEFLQARHIIIGGDGKVRFIDFDNANSATESAEHERQFVFESLRSIFKETSVIGLELLKIYTASYALGREGLKSEPVDKGGIDFRALPIVTQPAGMVGISRLTPDRINPSDLDLDKEWQQIENMLNAGIIPSIGRIKEYVEISCKAQNCQKRLDRVLSGVADMLRLEEERLAPTEAGLKQLLNLLESGSSITALQSALNKIEAFAKEPMIIGK